MDSTHTRIWKTTLKKLRRLHALSILEEKNESMLELLDRAVTRELERVENEQENDA